MFSFGVDHPYPPLRGGPLKNIIFLEISLIDICVNYEQISTKSSAICLLTRVISIRYKLKYVTPTRDNPTPYSKTLDISV